MKILIEAGIEHLKSKDKVLSKIISERTRCDLKPSRTYFRNLVRSIISQQLAVKASATIFRRFSEVLGGKITAENILKLDKRQFRKAGVSPQKMGYLIDLSKVYLQDKKIFDNLEKFSNEEIIQELTKIKGIGVWTAQMFLIFSLNRLNVLPLDDLGIKNSIRIHYKLKEHPDKETMTKIAVKWGKYSRIA